MIGKEKLVEMIETTDLEKLPGARDVWEKHIFLEDDKVLIVGYEEEEKFGDLKSEEEIINTFYWYWELRNSDSWELLYENHDNDYSFCESRLDISTGQDQLEDIVGGY